MIKLSHPQVLTIARAAAYDAINAEALRAFIWALPEAPMIVLDWQHPAYRFTPAAQALSW